MAKKKHVMDCGKEEANVKRDRDNTNQERGSSSSSVANNYFHLNIEQPGTCSVTESRVRRAVGGLLAAKLRQSLTQMEGSDLGEVPTCHVDDKGGF